MEDALNSLAQQEHAKEASVKRLTLLAEDSISLKVMQSCILKLALFAHKRAAYMQLRENFRLNFVNLAECLTLIRAPCQQVPGPSSLPEG